jgi:Putative Actinobacterial Holin-X, holin superfamily III
MSGSDTRPIPELFADALKQLSKLMRNELELARAEIAVKASEAISAVGLVIGAGVALIPALVLLLMALADWMEDDLGTGASTAHLIAGVAGLVIGGILAAIGTNRLKANSLVPKKTLEQFNRDVAAAKEHV